MDNVPIKVLLRLFSSNVVPVLLYGCEVWGAYVLGRTNSFDMFKNKFFSVVSDIEKLHLKFCKRVLGVHSKTTNLAVYAELGRVPMIVQISVSIVKYWLRVNHSLYEEELVGKAAHSCIQSKTQGVKFVDYLLEMCNIKSLNNIIVTTSSDISLLVKYLN